MSSTQRSTSRQQSVSPGIVIVLAILVSTFLFREATSLSLATRTTKNKHQQWRTTTTTNYQASQLEAPIHQHSTVMKALKDDDYLSSLSSSSPNNNSNNYYYGKNNNNNSGPYVPDGLTSDEYEKIKQDDAKKVSKLNFGAWGPRFKRSEKPDGDWMVTPKLWTFGFSSSNNKDAAASAPTTSFAKKLLVLVVQLGERSREFIKSYLPPFVLAFIGLDCVLTSIALLQTSQMTNQKILNTLLSNILFRRKSIALKYVKIMIWEVVLSAILARPMKHYLDWASENRDLWWQRSTWFVSVGTMFVAVNTWALLLAGLGTLSKCLSIVR